MKCFTKPYSISGGSDAAVAELAEQQRLRLISPRKWFRDAIEVNTDPALLNTRLIAQWLGATLPDARSLTLALNSSLCFGLYRNGRQIGFARVVTDMVETWVIRISSFRPSIVSSGSAHGCCTVACRIPVPEAAVISSPWASPFRTFSNATDLWLFPHYPAST